MRRSGWWKSALSVALVGVLVIGLMPTAGFATGDGAGEGAEAANVAAASATDDVTESSAAAEDAFDEGAGNIVLDAQTLYGGESVATVEADEIDDADGANAAAQTEGEGEAAGDADATASQEETYTAGPNPFKEGVDAQPLLDYDNYDKYVVTDDQGNVDKTETAKRWKTSVGCAGTKMWAGTLIQDNGYWDEPGWSFVSNWPTPDPLHAAEVYGYIEPSYASTVDGETRDVVFAEGDAGLTSLDLGAVFDGSYDVYIDGFAFKYNRLSSLTVPSFVKKIDYYAFQQDGTNAFLSNVQFETDANGNGIQYIAGNAFSSCSGLANQELIEIPESVQYLCGGAFLYCGALTVRIDNPDVRLNDDDPNDSSVRSPFDEGTTVYAYRYKTDGSDSDVYRLSQEDTSLNYVWLDEEAAKVSVTGTLELPEGVNASDAVVTLAQAGASHQLEVNENDGTFSYDSCQTATEATLTVELPGYYTQTFLRTAAQMKSDWNVGTIAAGSFSKIETQRSFPITVLQKTGGTDEDGNELVASIPDASKLSYTLKQGDAELTYGQDNDYVIQGGHVVLSEALASNEEALAQLKLQVTPDDALKLSSATVSLDFESRGFQAQLEPWGSATITTNAAFEDRSHVMVFDGTEDTARCIMDGYSSVNWPADQENPTWLFKTGQLKAGTYTVAACKPEVDFSVSHLRSLANVGIEYATATLTVSDGETTELTMDVPDYDSAQALADMGVQSLAVRGPSERVVVGLETRIQIDYTRDAAKAMAFELGISKDSYDAADVSAATADGAQVTPTCSQDAMTLRVPAGAASGTLYVSLKPTKEQIYSVPVTVKVGSAAAAAGDASFTAVGTTVDVPGSCVRQTGNEAEVRAAPSSTVQLSIDGENVGEAAQTNELGRARIAFDLPESLVGSLLFGDRVKLEATVTPEGAGGVAGGEGEQRFTAYTDCTYRPSAEIWNFSITNAGKTQARIKDGKESGDWLTVAYQIPQKKNAYWTFDVTVKNEGQALNAGDTLMMYAELENGESVAVPLSRKSSDSTYTRYVGEYVDEAYLEYLAAHEDEEGLFDISDMRDLFVPARYSFSSFSLAFAANLDDEDYLERVRERAEQETTDKQNYLLNLYWGSYEGSDTYTDLQKACGEVYEELGSLIDELEARDDAKSADVQAAIAEIEALRPDFRNPSSAFLAPDEETWTAKMDNPFFTGEEPEDVSWDAPNAAELAEWYGDEAVEVKNEDGTTELVKLTELAKQAFAELEAEIDQANSDAKNTQRQLTRAVDKLAEEAGASAPSESGSPYAFMDDNLESQCEDMLSISDGAAESGQAETSYGQGRFTADVYMTEAQKNGADGKTPGIYAGFTSVVSETAPQGIEEQEARVNSYSVDFADNHQTHDGAKADALKGLGWNFYGIGLDFASQGVDWAANHTMKNVLNRRLFSSMPIDKVTECVRAYAKAHLFDFEKKEIEEAFRLARAEGGFLNYLGLVSDYYGMQASTDSWCQGMDALGMIESDIEQINSWILYYKRFNPCDSDCQRCLDALYAERDAAEKYKVYLEVEDDNNWFDVKKGIASSITNSILGVCCLGSGGVTAANTAAGGQAATAVAEGANMAGGAISKASLAVDFASTEWHLLRAPWADVAKNAYAEATAYRESVCKSTKKKKEEESLTEEDKLRGTIDWDEFYKPLKKTSNIILDPSGTVYEALESNPVEGATATVWKRGDGPLGIGDAAWNAEGYEQVNPQVTGADGAFAWDVPTGEYQVRVTKEGYKDASTEWLSVLPVRTGLKVRLETTAAPQATGAADPKYVEVTFDQYMKASKDVGASIGGAEVERIEWVDVQQASDADGYGALSRTLRIYPTEPLAEGSTVEVKLTGAQNYVGTALGLPFVGWSQQLTVAKRPAQLVANFENAVVLQEGADATQLVAYVRYADGTPAVGQQVTAKLDSGSIAVFAGGDAAGADESGAVWVTATTDADGKATFGLSGSMAGYTTLTLGVADTMLSKELAVRVTSDAAQPARPVATVGGTTFGALSPKENAITVKAGAQLELTCSTEGATIYYTTDGTCPCKADGSRMEYTGPVAVTENTQFRIAAYKEGMPFDEYSERLNLTVTVEGAVNPDPDPDNPDPDPDPDDPTDPDDPNNPSGPVDPDNPNADDPQQPGDPASPNGEGGGADDATNAAAKAPQTLAQTGDQAPVVPCAALAFASAATLIAAARIRRRLI